MEYYIADGSHQKGPFSKEALVEKYLQHNTLVWCQGMKGWARAEEVPELKELLLSMPPPLPEVEKGATPKIAEIPEEDGSKSDECTYCGFPIRGDEVICPHCNKRLHFVIPKLKLSTKDGLGIVKKIKNLKAEPCPFCGEEPFIRDISDGKCPKCKLPAEPYTGSAGVVSILYLFFWLPGLIANIWFLAKGAKLKEETGVYPYGYKWMYLPLFIFVGLPILLFILFSLLKT